jgi:Tol biopolymer transport system component
MTPTDPFEDRLPAALTDLAQPLTSDFLPDLLVRTRRVRQRPAWTFLERWIPMTAITRRATTPLGGLRVALGLSVAILLALILAIGMLLATGSAPPAQVVAPRNGLIAYELDGDIWVADPDTTESRLLVGEPAPDYNPWWSRDGSRLVYARPSGDGEFLRTIDADGTDDISLTPEPLRGVTWFDWSPDDRELVISWDPDGDGAGSLARLATDGSGVLSRIETGMPSTYPNWSPDGSMILFRGVVGGSPGLYTVPASGGAVDGPLAELDTSSEAYRDLSDDVADGEWADYALLEPSWSPEGTRIAYHTLEVVPAAHIDGNGFRVHVMDADGSDPRRLEASVESDDEWGPLWAPDGRSLAFQALDADTAARNQMGRLALDIAVATMDDDAATVERLGPVAYLDYPGFPNQTVFGWAPDSSSVLAAESGVAAMTFDLGTGAVTALPWHADGVPSWQPLFEP